MYSNWAIIQKIILTNLATYPDMKVEKYQDPSIFLATYWNLSQKIWQFGFFFPLKIWQILAFFP
jgi:hypothetical protein